ncbi:YcnI family protein [Rhodococcus aerolatus]
MPVPRTPRPTRRRVALRVAATGTTTALLGLAAAGAASAHVVVDGTDTRQGGYGVVTLRVPTESDTASTTGVTVRLPTDTPLASVRTTPVPGWSVAVDGGDTPTAITWTAQPGGGLGPGQFGLFPFTAGPLPTADELALPTTQTYSDGTSVSWDEPTPADGTEPEHPVPTLALAAATGGDPDGAAPATGSGGAGVSAQAEPAAQTAAAPADGTARWLGGTGLVLGAAGLVLGAGALVRSRRRA